MFLFFHVDKCLFLFFIWSNTGKEDRRTFETASRQTMQEMQQAATHGYQVKGKTVKVAWYETCTFPCVDYVFKKQIFIVVLLLLHVGTFSTKKKCKVGWPYHHVDTSYVPFQTDLTLGKHCFVIVFGIRHPL